MLAYASELDGVSLGNSCAQRGKSVQPNTLFRCGAEKFIENEQLIVARFEFWEQSLDLFPVCAIDQVDSFRLPGQGDLSWTFILPQINECRPGRLDTVVWQHKIPKWKEVSVGEVVLISSIKLQPCFEIGLAGFSTLESSAPVRP